MCAGRCVLIAAVILAAGASRRLGEPKQLVKLGEVTLLERSVRVAREAGLSPVVVVLGCQADRILAGCEFGDAVKLVNDEWEEGMASSIRVGVAKCQDLLAKIEGIVILACDQPAVTAQHLQSLFSGTTSVTASKYGQRKGIPAYFPTSTFSELMTLHGDVGARDFLRDAASIELPHGNLDIDTVDNLQVARRLFS